MSLKSKLVLTGIFTAVTGVAGYAAYNTLYDYSDGVMAGTLTKISKKGILCKTYEAEMMLSVPRDIYGQGYTTNLKITVQDNDLGKEMEEKLSAAKGGILPMSIEYRQVLAKWSCLQDSHYVAMGFEGSKYETGPSNYMLFGGFGRGKPSRR